MRVRTMIVVFTCLFIGAHLALASAQTLTGSGSSYRSKYFGQEHRKIKSLSGQDIEKLQTGQGWGLAKAAELNGVPGPTHLLEMAQEIQLTPTQRKHIEQLYAEMKARAIPLGKQLITLEQDLNTVFVDGSITDDKLQELLAGIADVYRQLRYVHLSTHLKTPAILTSEQIQAYNILRGYSSDDPCNNIPAGHDVEMWKQHNNCP